MRTPEHYESDLLFFFDGRPLELSLYQALFQQLDGELLGWLREAWAFSETKGRG